jgi:predicted NAD/FAD-binding protein
VTNRPQWFSVVGGARNYVEKILASVQDKRLNTPVRLIERDAQGVRIITDGHAERFDEVVIATHTDQALSLLREPSPYERSLLGAIRYQDNRAVLHTDARVLPVNPKTWAAWNYERAASSERESSRVCLHYLLNRLQRIPFAQPVVVSLNPLQAIDPATIVGEYDYAHPVFDLAAIEAQKRLPLLQGQHHTWYAGAWTGYGFHEDGLKSGLQVGRALLKVIHEQANPVQDKLAA